MGKGIEAAKAANPQNAAFLSALDDMKDQLIIVLIKRLGGAREILSIPVAEVDGTGHDVLSFGVEGDNFIFHVGKKQ